MASMGTWRSPFPLRVGGGGHRRISDVYAGIQANRPNVTQSGEADIEARCAARMIATGYRATARRVAQADPARLLAVPREVTNPDTGEVVSVTPLERYEAIYGTKPPHGEGEEGRRNLVAARMAGLRGNSIADITLVMHRVLPGWKALVHHYSLADILAGAGNAAWPGGQGTAAFPGATVASEWRSDAAELRVYLEAPRTLSTGDIGRGLVKARSVLDDIVPAWATFEVVRVSDINNVGFIVGTSLLGSGTV